MSIPPNPNLPASNFQGFSTNRAATPPNRPQLTFGKVVKSTIGFVAGALVTFGVIFVWNVIGSLFRPAETGRKIVQAPEHDLRNIMRLRTQVLSEEASVDLGPAIKGHSPEVASTFAADPASTFNNAEPPTSLDVVVETLVRQRADVARPLRVAGRDAIEVAEHALPGPTGHQLGRSLDHTSVVQLTL